MFFCEEKIASRRNEIPRNYANGVAKMTRTETFESMSVHSQVARKAHQSCEAEKQKCREKKLNARRRNKTKKAGRSPEKRLKAVLRNVFESIGGSGNILMHTDGTEELSGSSR